jgi:predicted transcriptional regulator
MLKKILQFSVKDKSDEFTCSELVWCVFNLNDTDIQVFTTISKKKGMTVNQISQIIKKDRSTVHRSLEKLIACNLCYRERKSGPTRGFVDYYHTILIQEVFNKAEQRLDTCYQKLKKLIREDKKQSII